MVEPCRWGHSAPGIRRTYRVRHPLRKGGMPIRCSRMYLANYRP